MAFRPAETRGPFTFRTSHGSGNRTLTETVAADRVGVLEWLHYGTTVSAVIDVTIGSNKIWETQVAANSQGQFLFEGGIYSNVLGEDIVVTMTAAAGTSSINGKFR